MEYAYDELGNRLATTLPDGRQLQSLYYGSGHLMQMNLVGLDGASKVVSEFTRDALHREISRSQGKVNSYFRYDRHGRLSQRPVARNEHMETPKTGMDWHYDAGNNLCEIKQVPSSHLNQYYYYDALQRIKRNDDGNFINIPKPPEDAEFQQERKSI